MHPPFGFALFYLRSVAPKEDYQDRVTGKTIAKVTTGQIYWGSIPFIVIQIAMVVLVLLYPGMVTHYKADRPQVNIEDVKLDMGNFGGYGAGAEGETPATSDQDYNNMFK
jgi:hypothetical protein